MLKPDADAVKGFNVELADRVRGALDYLVTEVLERAPEGALAVPTPATYALQAVLREAAIAGDIARLGDLYDRHAAVLRDGLATGRPRIVPFDTSVLLPEELTLLQTVFSDDIGLTENLVAPDPAIVADATATMIRILEVMHHYVPEWASEYEALVNTVLLATTPGGSGTYAGASAFDGWGAILVNPVYRRDPLHLAMTMIHESSHLKLFYAYLDDDMVMNDPEATYSSPLRRQPRPMNGIYHAAFVLARMTTFANDLIQSGAAAAIAGNAEGPRLLSEEVARDVAGFEAAYEVIRDHGILSDRARTMIEEAAAGVDACKTSLQPA